MRFFRLMLIISMMMPAACACAWDQNDNSDRLSQNQSGVFSPGYVNAPYQQAIQTAREASRPKGFWEKMVDAISNKTSEAIDDKDKEKATVTMQQKTSNIQQSTTTTTTTSTTVNADELSFIKGTGTTNGTGSVAAGQQYLTTVVTNCTLAGNQYTNVAGAHTYYWEDFNGVRYIYAGTAGNQSQSLDVLKGALCLARRYMDQGKTVGILVASGTYGTDAAGTSLDLMPHLKFYGGYDADGKRNITANETIINQYMNMTDIHDTEINGFTLKTSREPQNIGLDRSYDLTIKNNHLINTRAQGSAFKFLDNSNILVYNNWLEGAYAYWGWGNGYFAYTGPHSNIVLRDNKRSNTFGEFRVANSPYGRSDYVRSDTGGTTGPTTRTSNFTISSTTTSTARAIDTKIYDLSLSKLSYNPYKANTLTSTLSSPTALSHNPESLAKDLKTSMTNKNAPENPAMPGMEARLQSQIQNKNLLKAAAAPPSQMVINKPRPGNVEAAYALMTNPTKEQESVINSVNELEAVLEEVDKEAANGKAASEEMQKAEDNLLQAVSKVLLAQGVPDLLKAGEVSSLKGIFKDLGQTKDKALLDYKESIKPYYDNVVKNLESSMGALQDKGILSKNLAKEELMKFEPREIDKVMDSIRQSGDKDLKGILDSEAKYRKEHLDPANKALQDMMIEMMNGFAADINKVLEEKK